jgi:glutamate receptor ionotropic, NMDA 2B
LTNGIDIYLLQSLGNYFNFTWKLVHCGEKWGKLINGTWNGLIGKVVNGSADIALGELSATAEREKVVDFTMPYIHDEITFCMLSSKHRDPVKNVLINSFSYQIWILIITMVIFSSILYPSLSRHRFLNIIWITIAALLQRGKS